MVENPKPFSLDERLQQKRQSRQFQIERIEAKLNDPGLEQTALQKERRELTKVRLLEAQARHS